jgi:hypothetical protein
VAGTRYLQIAPERVIHGIVRVKPKMQWSPQENGAVRNMKYLPRKSTGNK